MARFSETFKGRGVGRLLPPDSAPLERISREVGVSVTTLERWRDEALPAHGQAWTAAARLEAVIATAGRAR